MTVAAQQRVTFEKRSTDYGWFWKSSLPAKALRDHLRECATTFFKTASIGGDQEQSFEQAFSSLAYAYLKDKSPRLIDYIVGFQLVDRNEDNTKAMGVFGFKVGDQWLYAPVFFLNGDLKGHELLYIKKQDRFVPMKENWVNYLISRKPHVLGEGSARDSYQLGGVPPDIYRLTHPPTSSKYGADSYRPDIQDWSRDFLGFVGAVATKADTVFKKYAALAEQLDLGKFLKEDFSLLKAAWELTQKYPLLKTGFEKFYGKDFFLKMAQEMKKDAESLLVPMAPKTKKPGTAPKPRNEVFRQKTGSLIPDPPKKLHPVKTGALRVFVHDAWAADTRPKTLALTSLLSDEKVGEMRKAGADVGGKIKTDDSALGSIEHNKKELTEAEREKLLKDTVLIDDKRNPEDISEVYNTQVELALINPSETGIYDVLEKPGTFDEMLIVMHPHTNRGRESFCTVVRLSDPRNWLNIHSSRLFVRTSPKPGRDDYKKWFKKLTSVSSPEKGGHYIAVGPQGDGTTPFKIRQVYEDEAYQADFKDHASWGTATPQWQKNNEGFSSPSYGEGEYISTYDAKVFINKFPASKLRSVHGELSIPKEYKVFKLKDPPPPPKRRRDGSIIFDKDEVGMPPGDSLDSGSEKRPIQPGNLVDIQLMLNEKTASIRLMDTGGDFYVRANGREERMSKKAALIHLVRDHGCSEVAAREMLKTASAATIRHQAVVYRIKYADWVKDAEPNSNSALQGGPGMPAFPAPLTGMERVGPGAYPAMYPQEEFHMIPEMSANRTDPTIYDPFYQPDQRAMQMAQEASQSGQKEVFDTTMISGMLKAVRQDSLVDRYLGTLVQALDKIGRILFMFYWHQEEFEDRYGKQDLPELEDTARNAMEVVGDLTLFLLEKQVGGGLDGMGGVGKSEPDLEESARN